ncbi:MAG: SGNH/GDSL hydrolase family protein [Deltaproteobacteria bacterium]|nr:SGNH/GDSL hydrolase family protein [Deltaproteobacteria bacterium]
MQKLPRMFFVKCTRVVFVFFIMLMLGLQASPVHAGPITDIVVFGDSLSDTGNVYVSSPGFPPSPYFIGRFSNGPVWVETLAVGLGLTAPTPSLLGGMNYAWGGAETGHGSSFLGTPNIGVQIDAFLDGNTPSDKHLYVIWAGSNDFNNAVTLPVPVPEPAALVQNISGHITAIANAAPPGTELKFLVANLPPLGQTARAQWLGQYVHPLIPVALDLLSWKFNTLLSAALEELEENPGIKIFRLDIFSLTQEILMHPDVFGFTNVTDTARIPSISPGPPPDVTSPDAGIVTYPDEYFFFDDIHPTRVWHTIVGNRALSVVLSEPVAIDIKPQSDPNSINPRSKGKIPVAILSTMDFSAPDEVDIDSLMFGSSGGEESLSFCNHNPEDVNGDGYDDLVCHFYTQMTGFDCEDREGIVMGLTIDGIPIEGRDSVKIIPCKK